ncbi:MAG: class I SAM-dependent methyltransferase, partial [Opitutales bacterium]
MDTTARPQLVENHSTGRTARLKLMEIIFTKVLKGVRGGSIRMNFPSGASALVGDTSYPLLELNVHKPAFFKKVFAGGSVGLGESYVDGDWDTPDLTGLLSLLAKNQSSVGPLKRGLSLLSRQMNRLHHSARKNTVSRSRENIQEHYDLSNDFYAHFLDSTMTYSSARFESYYDTLEQAQLNKIDHMLELAAVKQGDHILEIGSGWGALALR